MIIVKLNGGLGNQMFQYALGRHLAIKHNTQLKINVSVFETYKLHKYSLSPFLIEEEFVSSEEVEKLRTNDLSFIDKISSVLLLKSNDKKILFVKEESYSFDPSILELSGNLCLEGYWQNERYFFEVEDVIRQEFTVRDQQLGKDKELAREIQLSDSISLHVRRGDYVTDSNTNQVHGTCDMEYYHSAIEVISETISEPHFFIFSDDPAWVYENFNIPSKVTFVDHNNADKNYEDLRLMSQCKHNIIANSSFSWWGAWLNKNSEKIVIAPEKWFANSPHDTSDLIPSSWLRF